MSLISSKLELVRQRPDGALIARCPACAEEGGDQTGNHLIIYPSGHFGCVVYREDDEQSRKHRRRIYALAGEPKGGRWPRKGHGSGKRAMIRPVLQPWQKK